METLIWDSRDLQSLVESGMPIAAAQEFLEDDLEEIRQLCDHTYKYGILVIGSLGRWNGRKDAFDEICTGELRECFSVHPDSIDIEWYLDDNNDLIRNVYHHDGVNHYKYRAWKEDVDSTTYSAVLNSIRKGEGSELLNRYTEPVGNYVGRVLFNFKEVKYA